MHFRMVIYLMFFLSGLSALVYQVLWVRLFSLIFGGSHMAVTTVLTVFMGGLALGGFLGRHTDRSSRPLRLYGLLEIGIGAAALTLLGLLQIYPGIYTAFAHMVGNQLALLTLGRLVFAVLALLLPTTLMGLTLPALAGFATRQGSSLGRHLAFLYGINTFGAVVGALSAGFFLLRHFTVTATYGLAVAISLAVGLLSLWLDGKIAAASPVGASEMAAQPTPLDGSRAIHEAVPTQLILVGIGLSGFCALGYEILWTRVLSIVVGTTVYGYTLMLVAFLIGIAIGGTSYQLLLRMIGPVDRNVNRAVLGFGLIQVVIGLLALLVSYALRDLPNHALAIETALRQWSGGEGSFLDTTNFIMALIYMLVPASFMGLAFPLAGDIVAHGRHRIGKAVGETLTYNTVGAILGAAVSGFLLIHLFGIERSLQCLSLVNLGLGLTVCARLTKRPLVPWSVAAATAAFLVWLTVNPGLLRSWDTKYFAIFNHNARQVFAKEEVREDIFASTEVLYYAEGTTSTISVVRFKGVNQAINVNGRTVASTNRSDRQCQYTLGHLPMLLHNNPRKVWVLGMGTGMTAGATSVHPEVESVTVVELEKHVPAAARTFAAYNHNFLDNPKVRVVFNDGRNFLLTTQERYDVITADPIHPWSQGSAYLYTDEYYRLASSRLQPGGIMCQWLPIYELTPRDLRSVVRTFANNFRYVYVWLTDYDAELIGSADPIDIDLDGLQRRIDAAPEVLADLRDVDMGSAPQLLSYAIMGPAGSRAFGEGAPLNSDDNLYLEFSAPDSKGKGELVAVNIASLAASREDLSAYLTGAALSEALGTDPSGLREATILYDRLHLLHYQGEMHLPDFSRLMATMANRFPWYAPGQFLLQEYETFRSRLPRLLDDIQLALVDEAGRPLTVTLSAVTIRVSPERVKLMIVDNRERKIYGHVYINGTAAEIEQLVRIQGEHLMRLIDGVYRQTMVDGTLPLARPTLGNIETVIKDFAADRG